VRHTLATNLVRADGSPVMVARLLAHARVDLARRYIMPAHGSQ
jgi:integrase